MCRVCARLIGLIQEKALAKPRNDSIDKREVDDEDKDWVYWLREFVVRNSDAGSFLLKDRSEGENWTKGMNQFWSLKGAASLSMQNIPHNFVQ